MSATAWSALIKLHNENRRKKQSEREKRGWWEERERRLSGAELIWVTVKRSTHRRCCTSSPRPLLLSDLMSLVSDFVFLPPQHVWDEKDFVTVSRFFQIDSVFIPGMSQPGWIDFWATLSAHVIGLECAWRWFSTRCKMCNFANDKKKDYLWSKRVKFNNFSPKLFLPDTFIMSHNQFLMLHHPKLLPHVY